MDEATIALIAFPIALAIAFAIGAFIERRNKRKTSIPIVNSHRPPETSKERIVHQSIGRTDIFKGSETSLCRDEDFSDQEGAVHSRIRESLAPKLPDSFKIYENLAEMNLRYRKTKSDIEEMTTSGKKDFYFKSMQDPCLMAVFRCGGSLIETLNSLGILDEFHRQLPDTVSRRAGGVFIDDGFKKRKELPSTKELRIELKRRRQLLYNALKEEYKSAKAMERYERRSQPNYYAKIRFSVIKSLACIALLAGFADMPNGYYQLLRWVVFSAAGWTLWENSKSDRSEGWKSFMMFFFGAIAITFNPIFPIYFDREVWEILDVIALFAFITSPALIVFRFAQKNAINILAFIILSAVLFLTVESCASPEKTKKKSSLDRRSEEYTKRWLRENPLPTR